MTEALSSSSDEMEITVNLEPVSQQAFLDLLRTYLTDNVERVERARGTGAGWEIWLQVEMCMFVRWEITGDIFREKAYGGDTKGRADFLLNGNQAKGKTIVEIKTNTSGEQAYTFVKRVAMDFEKQLDAPKGTRTLVVGVWVGPDPSKSTKGEVIQVTPLVPGRIYLLHSGIA